MFDDEESSRCVLAFVVPLDGFASGIARGAETEFGVGFSDTQVFIPIGPVFKSKHGCRLENRLALLMQKHLSEPVEAQIGIGEPHITEDGVAWRVKADTLFYALLDSIADIVRNEDGLYWTDRSELSAVFATHKDCELLSDEQKACVLAAAERKKKMKGSCAVSGLCLLYKFHKNDTWAEYWLHKEVA